MLKKDNILLIGMPSSGKSTIGKLVAQHYNYTFIDTDQYIENKENKKLQQLINELGDINFCSMEEKRIFELLPLTKHVLAPGGSIIYSEKIMNALKKDSYIVFLDVPLKELEERLDNKESRGIVGLKSKNIKCLYNERVPLYNKYAHVKISCYNKSPDQIAREIIQKINKLEGI